MSFYVNSFLLIFFSLFTYLDCLDSNKIIFLPFKTKNLRIGSEDETLEEYIKNINASSFLEKFFYNGIYASLQIGVKNELLSTFFNFDNSYFFVSKCNDIKHISYYTLTKERFIGSNSLTKRKIDDKNYLFDIANEYFLFYNSTNYYTIYINEEFNGLDFIYDDNNSNEDKICGNIGLNLNLNNYENKNTNFIEQLKRKKIISKYIWTLDYTSFTKGNIIIGIEPHFYESKNYFSYQYKTIYSNLNNNNKIWSFNFDKINLNGTDINLKDTNVELIINHGLIIGTEEYKNIVDKIYFTKLIDDGICFNENIKLNTSETELNNEYIIYYCDKLKFRGKFRNIANSKDEPINKFNDILLSQNGFEYIFKMDKNMLFEEISERVYFLIIFNKNNNKIWKLGEPFLYKYKFVFNQEQKTIGFYNHLLKETKEEYDSDDKNKKSNDYNKTQIIINYIIGIMIIILFIVIIIYIIKKLLIKKKTRANELVDDYEYVSNSNNENKNEIKYNYNISNESINNIS